MNKDIVKYPNGDFAVVSTMSPEQYLEYMLVTCADALGIPADAIRSQYPKKQPRSFPPEEANNPFLNPNLGIPYVTD